MEGGVENSEGALGVESLYMLGFKLSIETLAERSQGLGGQLGFHCGAKVEISNFSKRGRRQAKQVKSNQPSAVDDALVVGLVLILLVVAGA